MNIVKLFLFGSCLFCLLSLNAQETIIGINSQINVMPGTVIILANGMGLENNSSAGSLNGTCVFRGILPQKISGSQAVEFANLEIEQGAFLSLYNDVKISSSLSLNGGIVNLLNNNLTLLSGATLSGSYSETNMIAAESAGKLGYHISENGTYLFPVGDTSKMVDYSPATLIFKSGTYNNAFVSMNLKNSKHPNNLKSVNYLDRYWTVTQEGVSSFECDVNFTYTNDDIQGSESDIYGAKWDGENWTGLNKSSLNIVSGTVNSFSDFTGADQTLLNNEELISDNVEIYTSKNKIIIKSHDNYKLISAEVFNKLGQKVYIKDLSKTNYNEIELNEISDVFLVRINSESDSYTKKIFVN